MLLKVRRHIAKLKRDFPLDLPVRVRTFKKLVNHSNDRLFGAAAKLNGHYEIYIQRHADASVQIDTLWHEWAHCLLWPRCRLRHSAAFWAVYGKIYSHYQD